jgi:hypothetical protein
MTLLASRPDMFSVFKREPSFVLTRRNYRVVLFPKLDRRIPYEKPRDFGTIQ